MSDLQATVARLTTALERALERLADNSTPVCVTKARAAVELGVSDKTISRMVRDGELSVVLVRGRPRIPFADLLRVGTPKGVRREPTRIEKFNARAEAERARALRRAR